VSTTEHDEDEWTLDGFLAQIEAMEDSPPPTPEWQERIDCDRHRWPTYVAHVEGMYPAECPSCSYERQQERITELQHRTHRRYWKWKITARFARRAYPLGIISGSSWGNMCSLCGTTTRISWRGRRPYVLGMKREEWACLLKRRHRYRLHYPSGLCAICCPCPDCGSTDVDHYTCEATS
jgi:hypothetical protein